jgi:hypothetical protein
MKQTKLTDDLLAYWNAPSITPQLPIWRQIAEMILLYFLRRIGPGYYLQARWGRVEIPFKHKWQHVNRYEYRRLTQRLNPIAYRKASQHKMIEKAVLSLQNIPTPKFIGYVHFLRGRSGQGHPLRNVADLTKLLTNHVNERVCFKPVEGFGGFGFASYEISWINESILLRRKPDEAPLSLDDWWKANGQDTEGFVLESYLVQHADMTALNASSVNTIRMWVVNLNQQAQILGAYLRIGRNGSQVDNHSSGGIACRIELATGLIQIGIDPARPGYPVFSHPDSNICLTGFQIPFWPEVLNWATEIVLAFPHINFVGLDVAITPTGPYLIEANPIPDYVGCAYMDLALKEKFYGED